MDEVRAINKIVVNYDYDDNKYQGIRHIGNLFSEVDEDYTNQ